MEIYQTLSRPSLPLVRLVVSSDGEQYRVVDVTGARDGSDVRGQIFSKVSSTLRRSRSFIDGRSARHPDRVAAIIFHLPIRNRVVCARKPFIRWELILTVSGAWQSVRLPQILRIALPEWSRKTTGIGFRKIVYPRK